LQGREDLLPVEAGFPRPDWDAIAKIVEAQPESDWDRLWTNWAQKWVDSIAANLGSDYRVSETENFIVLSAQDDRYVDLLSSFLERTLRKILSMLDAIAKDDGFGKNVVLIFDEQESYYEYMAHFYPNEGEFILSSGIFLNSAYCHFAFPFLEMFAAEATAAHEMTHACLRHLPIPLWLDEGFAVTMEDEICGSQPLIMDRDRILEHKRFWTADTIQEFWSGESFNRTDEGSDLSYELARYCLRALSHDHADIAAFSNAASHEDSGESAAIEIYGGRLGGLIHQFFGDGDWAPNPKLWSDSKAS